MDKSLRRARLSVRIRSRPTDGLETRYRHVHTSITPFLRGFVFYTYHAQGWEYWFPRPVKTADEKPLIVLGGARNAVFPALEDVDDDTACHPKIGEVLRGFLPAVFEGKFEPGREPEMEWVRA